MSTYKLFIPILVIAILLSACGDKKETSEDLRQAFELHLEAIKTRQLTKEKLARLKAHTDTVFVKTYGQHLDSLDQLLEAWDENLIEVPGFEEEHDHDHHDHDHDHDHHHHHNAQQDLTPKQHLEVQRHLLEEIKGISKKIDAIQ